MTNNTIRLPRLMDASLREKARLHPASLSLEETLTPLSTAEMILPPGEADPIPGDFVELFNPEGSAGIYRVSAVETLSGEKPSRQLTLEHALCTLEDTLLFGFHAYDGLVTDTSQVLADLLSRQQEIRWQLGECEAAESLSYTLETGSLLDALLAVLSPLVTPCRLEYDFSTLPWTLHLRRLPDVPACECRMCRNLTGVKVTIDRSDLCTRLYPLGYGEGADQLTIRDVHGDVPYLEADTLSLYGPVEKAYTDRTITDPETLLSAASALMEKVKHPLVTVELSALELSRLTGESLDRFTLGALCRLCLPEEGMVLDQRIIAIRRPDVYGNPAQVRLTLANRSASASADLADLRHRALVSEVYSQGAASEYALHFGDNADAGHPAVLKFYIDEDALHVNKVMVRYALEAFRGYSKATSGGAKSGVAVSWASGMDVTSGISTVTAVSGQPHTHDLTVDVSLPDLVVSLDSHTHGVNPGIYEGGTASSVTIAVDGTVLPAEAVSASGFDAAPYLSRTSRGKIRRGAWHTISFTPDGETRIIADLHVRTFIRTVTGANL